MTVPYIVNAILPLSLPLSFSLPSRGYRFGIIARSAFLSSSGGDGVQVAYVWMWRVSSIERERASSSSAAVERARVRPAEAAAAAAVQSPALVGAKIQRGWVWSIEILFRC